MRILAFDPGYNRLGIAVIDKKKKEELIYSSCFVTDKSVAPEKRLFALGSEMRERIKEFKPDGIALEKLFFTKNQKTALKVAEVRGLIQECAGEFKLPIFEYGPTEIKVAMTGYGKSDKSQVTFMVKKILNFDKKGALDDEYDAIAVGLTCFAYEKFR